MPVTSQLPWLLEQFLTTHEPVRFMDATFVPVCRLVRAHTHRVAKTRANWGKNHQGWHYGFKLHASVDMHGRLCGIALTPANVSDIRMIPTLVNEHTRVVVGDGGYTARVMREHIWETYGTMIISPPHPKQRKKIMTTWQQLLLKMRPKVESTFDYLVEPKFLARDRKQKTHSQRKRAIGAGPKRKLSIEQALFGLLLYYRTYTNHVFMGLVLGIDDSNVGRYFGKIEPLLAKVFKIPEKKVDMSEEEIMELIFDATEQPSQRRPGSGYSGKKKQQTIKNQIAVTPQGKLKSVSKTVAGNMHDKKLYDNTGVYTLEKVKRKADLAYLGTTCQIPYKKSKKRALTARQKEYNQKFNSERIIVEHTIAHLKKFQILAQRFRHPIKKHSLIFKNIAGIRNLQIA